MTKSDLEHIGAVLQSEPTFEFLSPEGHVGYPPDLLELDEATFAQLVNSYKQYEAQALLFAGANDPPVPGENAQTISP